MLRKFGLAAFAIALAGAFFTLSAAFAAEEKKEKEGKKEETASIHDIMESVPGKKGLVAKLGTAAKDEKWDDAAKIGETLKKYGADLGKNTPEKGSKESWAKLSKKFQENMDALAKGAADKDAKAIGEASKSFGSSCKSCHDAHQKK